MCACFLSNQQLCMRPVSAWNFVYYFFFFFFSWSSCLLCFILTQTLLPCADVIHFAQCVAASILSTTECLSWAVRLHQRRQTKTLLLILSRAVCSFKIFLLWSAFASSPPSLSLPLVIMESALEMHQVTFMWFEGTFSYAFSLEVHVSFILV